MLGHPQVGFQDLHKGFQKRRRVLEKLWKPVSGPISVILALLWVYGFFRAHGELSPPLFGILVLLLFILQSAPVSSISLVAKRILAFATDVALLAVATILVFGLFLIQGKGLPGPILMLVTWLWFMYFVTGDSYFRGTIGKKFFGVRLRLSGKPLSFSRSLIRTFLTVPLPIFVATSISQAISPFTSPTHFIAIITVRQAILAFIPISIFVFGGDRGIVDKLVGSEVSHRRKTRSVSDHQAVSRILENKKWLWLLGFCIAWGLLFAWLSFSAYGKSALGISSQNVKSDFVTQYRRMGGPENEAALGTTVARGVREPMNVISSIQLLQAAPNPFVIEKTSSSPPPHFAEEFEKLGEIQIMRIWLRPGNSLLTKTLIMSNLVEMAASGTLESNAQYHAVQLGTECDFGIFIVRFGESFVLWAAGAKTTISTVQPSVSLEVKVSLDRVRWLLSGDWHSKLP